MWRPYKDEVVGSVVMVALCVVVLGRWVMGPSAEPMPPSAETANLQTEPASGRPAYLSEPGPLDPLLCANGIVEACDGQDGGR